MSHPTCIILDPLEAAERQIRAKVRMVLANEESFGVLSTGERIAVAFVLDRPELVQKAWGSLLESIERLGVQWTRAALRVQRFGWEEEDANA